MSLLDPYGRVIQQPDIHDPRGVSPEDAAILMRLAEELRALDLREDTHELFMALSPLQALQLAGLLQLALRHPGTAYDIRETAISVLEYVRDYFADCPAVLAIIARGDDPTQDVER